MITLKHERIGDTYIISFMFECYFFVKTYYKGNSMKNYVLDTSTLIYDPSILKEGYPR